MARRLEQTTLYSDGWKDEWGPYDEVDVRGWRDAEFRRYVREFNRAAKARGDNMRLRSVEGEKPFTLAPLKRAQHIATDQPISHFQALSASSAEPTVPSSISLMKLPHDFTNSTPRSET